MAQADNPLMSRNDWDTGMLWEEYLEYVPRSQSMQIKRYESITREERDLFRASPVSGKMMILSEELCGDGAWAIPQVVRLVEAIDGLEYRIFFRDERPDLMDKLLSDGKRAIPKIALLDQDLKIVDTWGPYPEAIKPYVHEHAGIRERAEWYPRVLKYYREQGHDDLIHDMKRLFQIG